MSGRNTASRLGRHEPSPSRLDVQESFRHHPLWPLISAPDLPDRIDPLIGAVRAAGDRVVWVLHAEPGTGGPFDPASGHVRPMDGLAPAGGEPVLTKTSHNAFTTTNLHQYLTAHGVRELVISGIRTEQCCETTARIGADLGYRVTFVTDATATNPIPPPGSPPGLTPAQVLADPRTLPVDDVIAGTEYALSGRFAEIRTIADLTR
ncbi:cysteine hydrolase family protein [Actinomadura rugatobispora]|uniref:Cysteine hydrolase family protein n=1 Tax=Actinomadura rugatobispora TaxID=1994 RepID=A0ABW0ZU67_9ACTN